MLGRGTLIINNCPCFMGGIGTLTIKGASSGQVTMGGVGTLYAFATKAAGARSFLPAVSSQGGSVAYGLSRQELPPMTTAGGEEAYTPPVPVRGYGNLPAFVSFGLGSLVNVGNGAVTLPAMQSRGGDFNYGLGEQTIPPMVSRGGSQNQTSMSVFSLAQAVSTVSLAMEQILIFNSLGTLISSFVGTRVLIQEMLSTLTASSSFSLLAEFSMGLVSSMTGSSINMAQVGTKPVLDATSRVWVVNMDTFATSQYDDYGFTEFYTENGISYGIAEDGIYELTGDTDAGTPIDALIDFGRSDLGSAQKKRVPCVYYGISSTGKMLLKVYADEQVYIYEARSASTEIKNHRVDIGKGLTGNYWDFVLLNQAGCDFDLETITFEPIPLSRKI